MSSTQSQHNNFDFLRILAASLVLFSHQFDLLKLPSPAVLPVGFGELGVCIFFSISGYLVTQSWTNDPHIFRFMARRFLRIWPGLIVATCLAALIMGPAVSIFSFSAYFKNTQVFIYFQTLLLKIQFFLPGVFTDNPYPNAVNGSLWTIPLEVKCYAILLVAGALSLLNSKWLIFATFLVLACIHFRIFHTETHPGMNYLRNFGLYFLYGTCMHLFQHYWKSKKTVGLIIVCLLTYLATSLSQPLVALLIAVPYGVVVFGSTSTPFFNRFGRFGDLSYGIYIYAFPVQQCVIWLIHGRYSLWVHLALSFTATISLSFFSWHWVEKPAMKLKPKKKTTAPA